MKIYVDADACPVKGIIVSEAKKRNIEVVMVCDTSHIINDGYSKTITVDYGRDSADIVLVNMLTEGDVVITQDFGLAAVALSKKAVALNQNGMIYDDENIEMLLFERFLAAKSRKIGKNTKRIAKRKTEDDKNFTASFLQVLRGIKNV